MKSNQDDPRRYDDMIGLPHPVSAVHPRMDVRKRAAQFAPFAALTGYGDAIAETQRLTRDRMELDENSREILDEKLRLIKERLYSHPDVTITYYVPDLKKEGGDYITVSGEVMGVDLYERRLVLEGDIRIPLDEVIDMEGQIFEKYG